MTRLLRLCALLSLLLGGTDAANADLPSEPASFLALGGHYGHFYEAAEWTPGFTAACVFRPGAVAQFSETLSRRGLGLCLRYSSSAVKGQARVRSAEFSARRYFGATGRSAFPYLEVGLGQSGVRYDSGGSRSTWTAVLGGGVEWDLTSRFILQLELLTRMVEFSNDSFTMTALTLSFGARFDA